MLIFDGPKAEAERLLATMADEQIVLRTGLPLEEVIALRAFRAAAPFPPILRRRVDPGTPH